MRRSVVMAAVVLSTVLAVSAAGCGSSGTSANGKTFSIEDTDIQAKVGDQFVIELESNATTGFQWGISGSLNPSVVSKVRSTYVAGPNAQKMVGAGGVERWTFKALGKGTAKIAMIYTQPWEKTTKPAKSVTFNVTVQ